MTTTTNFRKWAGYLLLTGIFLLSGFSITNAQDLGDGGGKDGTKGEQITDICIPFNTKSYTLVFPTINGCTRGTVTWTYQGSLRDSVVIGDGSATINVIDTSKIYTFIGCCRGS